MNNRDRPRFSHINPKNRGRSPIVLPYCPRGKPVLVMRDVTERSEAVEASKVWLVGADRAKIVAEVEIILNNETVYTAMSQSLW